VEDPLKDISKNQEKEAVSATSV